MNKLDMKSENIIDDNIEYIREKFPNVVVESEKGYAIDFNVLKQELSDVIVDETKEKYQLTWPGKKEAIVTANTPTTKTLRPVREKSVNFDTTENIYIEGDNLEALKILQESYLGKIKCIYIDPPYNTGNDFIYKDKFNKDSNHELLDSGQIDEDGNRLITNTHSNGKFHSDWLSMMYPRLKLARNLLSNDGVIFISIDCHELTNLIKICDDIFGESNRLGIISVINNMKGRSDSTYFATCNEFLLCYAKSENFSSISGLKIESDEIDDDYKFEDEISKYKPIGFRKTGNGWKREDRPYMFYPIIEKNGEFNTVLIDEYHRIYNSNTNTFNDEYIKFLKEKYTKQGYNFILPQDENGNFGRWRWGLETFYEEKDINLALNPNGKICTKMRATIEDGSVRTKSAKTLWYKPEYDTGSGAKVLNSLFDNKKMFDNPKSLLFIMDILKIAIDKDDLILDFFSGSATVSHAVMQLNAEDNGHRKFIMIQLPEICNESSEAYINGYKTICDLGEERIRRAAKKIKEETNADIDYGFRVYKIDSSNMKDVYYKPSELNQEQLNLFETNIKEDRTSEDLLTQVILDLGLTLDLKIEEKNILGNKVYFVDENSLVACFDDNLNINIVDEICKYKPLKVVFKDSSFKNDNDKINLEEKIKKLSPDTEINIL